MSVAITSAGRSAMLEGLLTVLNGGYIDIYSGVQPAAGVPVSDPVQARIPLVVPAGQVSSGTLTLFPADGIRLAAQDLTWGRVVTNSGQVVLDFSVSASGGGGDMIVSAVSGSLGGFVQLTAASIGF